MPEMRKLILSVGLIIISFSSTLGQNTHKVNQKSLLKIGLFGPNIEYEAKISQDFTVVSEAGVTLAFGYGGNEIGTIFEYGLIAKISPRYYYNFGNRIEDGKSIRNFSGNYISFNSIAVLNSVLSSTDDPNQYIFDLTCEIL